jgi:hypothetical protein
VTLEVILADHVFSFESRLKTLGAEVLGAIQPSQLGPDLLIHIGPLFPQTDQGLIRDLEVTVVELGEDFLVLGAGDPSDTAVGSTHGEKFAGVVRRQYRPLPRVTLTAGERQTLLIHRPMRSPNV